MNPVCGPGIVDSGEECNDGNTVDADGCQGECMNLEHDDGHTVYGDGCQGDCMNRVSSDGILVPQKCKHGIM